MREVPTDSSARATDSRAPHLPAIGALRGIAALYVVFHHLTYVPKVRPAIADGLLPFVTAGYSGVPLFFLMSAFTLCHTMQVRPESHPTLRFYARRAIRIMPLFYVVLAVSVARFVLMQRRVSIASLLVNMSMLFNFAPGHEKGIVAASWSIGVEMPFYMMFPWIFRWVTSVPRAVVFFIASLALSVLFALVVDRLPYPPAMREDFYRYSLLRSLPCFAVGMIVFRAYKLLPAGLPRSRAYALLAAAGLGFVVVVEHQRINAFVEYAVVYGVLTIGLLFTNPKVIVNRFTEFLGDISYSLYLWHPLAILYVSVLYPRFYVHLPKTLAWFGCLSLTLGVLIPIAFVSYKLIEEPTRKAGMRMLRRWS